MTDKHNGWTNYETWLCALWLDNDVASQGLMRGLAAGAYAEAEADDTFTRSEKATLDLADQIKDMHEEMAEEFMSSQSGFFTDLINGGLSSVNWYEVAEHYISSAVEDAA